VRIPEAVYSAAWALWIAWFVLWETLALFDVSRPDGTFTEHIRPWVQSTWVGSILGGLFLLWLAWHFLVEGRS